MTVVAVDLPVEYEISLVYWQTQYWICTAQGQTSYYVKFAEVMNVILGGLSLSDTTNLPCMEASFLLEFLK